MKNTVAFLVIVCMLVLVLMACTENRLSQETTRETVAVDQTAEDRTTEDRTTEDSTAEDQTTEEVADAVTREDYVDLSFDVPTPKGRQETIVSMRVEGNKPIVGSDEQYLKVDHVSNNCISAGDAIYDIASQIASRFEAAEVQADITVGAKSYAQNTSQAVGSVEYVASAVLVNGATITIESIAKIPAFSGIWLGATKGDFGATHNAKDQWKDWFDPSGMVLLKNNILVCIEGIEDMEYALISVDGTYDDPDIIWYTPQVLEMNQRGFDVLFANAYLDYADRLVAGERYRFLVRGVSNCQNYILHLDIPFTYQPLSSTAESALAEAMETVKGTVRNLTYEESNSVEILKQRLTEVVGNPDVAVDVTLLGEGLNSVTVSVELTYQATINQARLPSYKLNGEAFTAVYSFKGTSFAIKTSMLSYEAFDGDILLQSPYDGARNVPIASRYIRKVFTSPLERLREPIFGYLMGENCNPVPVFLTWNDKSGEAGKTYTVTISEHSDFSDARVFTTSQTKIAVNSLKTNATYYWKVSDGKQQSQTFIFTTESPMACFMVVDGVSNFRDIGGYVTKDGLRVKQGLAFRSAALDSITQEGKETMLETLGIKTELDLRGTGVAALGSEVNREVIAMQWFDHIFEPKNYEAVRTTIAAFAVEENYPLNFHCAVGRDRTGTTAFLILGLLGVEEEILVRDYFCSFFSAEASVPANDIPLHLPNIDGLVEGIKEYGPADATLQEHIEQYLLTIGITSEEMESIRYILLDGYDGTASGSTD